MNIAELKPIIEAMVFVSSEPLDEASIVAALADAGVGLGEVRACLAEIGREWNEDAGRGIGFVPVAGGYQFRTKSIHAEWLRRLNLPKPVRLSGPALETLSIVAYRQPIVRSEIERIRGVDSGAVLKTLLERRVLRIVGRRDEPGQPLLYGTTREFLEIFNLNALTELPTLKDIEELMRERRTITESGQPLPPDASPQDENPFADILVTPEKSPEREPAAARGSEAAEEEGDQDFEALSNLEQNLKQLRRLERGIFPGSHGVGEERAGGGENHEEGAEPSSQRGALPPRPSGGGEGLAEAPPDAGGADAPASDDRPGE